MRNVHFIGIGGVGMNGLAQLAAQSDYDVTGSDRAFHPESELFRSLEKLGIRLVPQDGSGIDGQTDAVVYSTAIESDNPDIQQTKTRGIPLLHRSEFLKELVGNDELIAVAGTAGKTTTTGLLGWIFECLGKNPSVYNGAAVLNWKKFPNPGNVRRGSSKLWIIEADESDKSFLNFRPTHSIITNITKDHFELDELHAMFSQFESQTSGITVHGSKTMNPNNVRTNLIGRHNMENVRSAITLCSELNMDIEAVLRAVATFKGIERRLEVSGVADGVTIIDDYAHNPAKIRAALAAVNEAYGTVHAYWRPHGFSPLFQNMDELTAVFSNHWNKNNGSIFILPVYYAGGTVEKKATAKDLVNHLISAGVPARHVQDYESLKCELQKCAKAGDVILGMGARDPELPLFAQHLVTEWKTT